jgi:hypothetical protein
MKKKLIAAGAAGLTVATVVTGLSFGATAFSASPDGSSTGPLVGDALSAGDPAHPRTTGTAASPGETGDTIQDSSDDSVRARDTRPGQASSTRITPSSTYKLVLQAGTGQYYAYTAVNNYTKYTQSSSLASAERAATDLSVSQNGDGTFRLTESGGCLYFAISQEDSDGDGRVEENGTRFLSAIQSTSSCASFTLRADGTLHASSRYAGGTLAGVGGGRSNGYSQVGLGIGSPGWQAVGDTTPIEPVRQIAASVSSVDHLDRSAVISGTATPGARVEVGGSWVDADATTGAFSVTVAALSNGANPLTVVQKIDNVQVGNSFPLTVTIVEGGTVVPVPQPGVELVRGESTAVPFVVSVTQSRTSVTGTATITAPAGTTFTPGQTRVAGQYRYNSETWNNAPALDLTGGVRSDDGRTMSYTVGPTNASHPGVQDWRYILSIDTPMVAAGGASSMGYVYEGSSTGDPYRAVGSTPTTIEVNEQPTVANVVSVDPIAKTAVVSGTATPGSTITIGDQTDVANEAGEWSIVVEGLQVGSNQLVVQQSIAGEDYGDPVTLDAVVPALTTSLGANDVTVTSEADGWFTEGTEGTVTITTQTGTSPTGATVRPGESLSWTTTLPEGFEAGDLPATETVDGWTTEHVVATDSEGRQTVEVKLTNATTENKEYAAAGDITFPVVSTGKPAADGTITTVFTPPTSYTSSAPDASTVAKAPLPLTATVAQRNDIAQTVVVTGSGTPGQQVTIGDVTETIRPDGSYEITAPFTGTGDLEVTVSQEIGGTVHDEATVDFTSVEGGTLIGVQQTRVNLPRNTTSIIPIVVQNNEAREAATGTVTFTAPKDTIFQDGLTVLGERRSGTAGGWESDASLDLTDGVISENGTKITFQLPARAIPAEQQLRYLVEVFTSRTASAGNRQLDYTYEGTSSIGDFRATGSTIGRVASIDPSAIRE